MSPFISSSLQRSGTSYQSPSTKGFMLKFNPDTHRSNALYCSLNVLQLTSGENIMFVNRDDASRFRLDTLTTHHQYSNPVVKGKKLWQRTLTALIITDQWSRLPTTISQEPWLLLNYVRVLFRPSRCFWKVLHSTWLVWICCRSKMNLRQQFMVNVRWSNVSEGMGQMTRALHT